MPRDRPKRGEQAAAGAGLSSVPGEERLGKYGSPHGPAASFNELRIGSKLRAAYTDGEFYPAIVVAISVRKVTRAKVHYIGYDKTEDRWIPIRELRSERSPEAAPSAISAESRAEAEDIRKTERMRRKCAEEDRRGKGCEREASLLKIRVRDVKEHFGHLYEIPLRAYIDAGVASSWRDFVDESDIEAASNAWDAACLAREIDTQWGFAPSGGAYKDSRRYFGPSEYDYY